MRVPPPGETGLTLIEMLIVLAIIGVAAGATVLGMGAAARGQTVAAEANRLAAGIRLAADDAMLDDRAMGLEWDRRGYAFSGATKDDGALAPHVLPSGMALVMPAAAGHLPLGIDGRGAPFVARVETAREQWTVRYDGITATASPVPAA